MPIFDCNHTPDPVCPYCGEVQGGAWKLDLSTGETKEICCQNCEFTFGVTASISIEQERRWITHPRFLKLRQAVLDREAEAKRQANIKMNEEVEDLPDGAFKESGTTISTVVLKVTI
jgi:hypothetical protein